jgi:uncharacterized protein (DUF362 family)
VTTAEQGMIQRDRSRVALVRCETYDPEVVYGALKRGVELLGGLDRFVQRGERILLKPNILAGDGPTSAVTTHPAVLAGCSRLLQEGGAEVRFGDSPGLENAARAARGSGLEKATSQPVARLATRRAGWSRTLRWPRRCTRVMASSTCPR